MPLRTWNYSVWRWDRADFLDLVGYVKAPTKDEAVRLKCGRFSDQDRFLALPMKDLTARGKDGVPKRR